MLGRSGARVAPAPRRPRDRRLAFQRGRARGHRLRRRPGDPAGGRYPSDSSQPEPERRRCSTPRPSFRRPALLFVGQLLPHKRPDLPREDDACRGDVSRVASDAHARRPERFARYADGRSREQVRELNLPQVHVVGSVDDARSRGDVPLAPTSFVTVSEHEGFCVPLVEAMAFDVPIVARACAAIPETVGDGALLLPPWAGSGVLRRADRTRCSATNRCAAIWCAGGAAPSGASSSACRAGVAMLEAICEVV